MANEPIRVLVWDENPDNAPADVYPDGLNGAIADGLLEIGGEELLEVHVANIDDPDQGLTDSNLAESHVLIWWGHRRHAEVADERVAQIVSRVTQGQLGFIALHSAHYSKPFQKLLGCTGHLKGGWRDEPQHEEIRVCAPDHPIAREVPDFALAMEEMYGAPFDVPPAEVVVFQSQFPADGRYFPSGLCWTVGAGIQPGFESGPGGGVRQGVGAGRVFYFRPGHETVPTFLNPTVRHVLFNAVLWAAGRDEEAEE
jgi:trehalose utilization protein